MDQTAMQQMWQRLEAEERTLLALPPQPSPDAIASALALFLVLKQLNKKPTIATHQFHLPSGLQFLSDYAAIEPTLRVKNQFVISVDISKAAVEELSYDIRGDALHIFLTPKGGKLSPSDLSTSGGNPDFPLIVTLSTHDLAALGPLFEEHADFFYETPILNIDHQSGNTEFGQINLIDLPAAATAEIVYELIKHKDPKLITEPVATCLLTGIIANTQGFHASVVTPKTLSTASALVAAGARREEILKHLYQSKPIATLRLWGRVLARVQSEADGRALISRLREDDFTKAGATAEVIPGVLDELLHAASRAEIAIVLFQKANGDIEGSMHSRSSVDLPRLFHDDHTEQRGATLRLLTTGIPLEDVEKHVREVVRRHYHIS